jgi:alkylation response protein AidB-like acyl-CoA dehydrogenase
MATPIAYSGSMAEGAADNRFALDAHSRAFSGEVRRIARERLAPIARVGPHGRVDRALVKALAEEGILPRLFPEHLGGTGNGVSALELCLLREALAQESTEAETALALQGLGSYPLLQSGSDELARKWIPPVASGNAVAAFALTEPGAGSDAAGLELYADEDGSGFRLTGEKTYISNAPDADIYTVFARTKRGTRARGVTAFAVAGDSPGLSGEPQELLAPHPIGRLTFDAVPVRRDCVLGEVDAGFRVAMRTLDLFRPSVGAFGVGMAQAALDAAVARADVRMVAGRPLRDYQAVSHTLAEMATRVAAARLLVYAAASAHDGGERVTAAAAMAKLYATETAQFVVDAAIQIHGAQGLEKGHLLEHLYREVRATRIYEGASEVQREVVARELYGRRVSDPSTPAAASR